jgi:hypothetical protein
MSKRRKRLILLACGILALAVLWQLLRDREPSYQGRTLSEWIDQTRQDGVENEIEEARIAIRAIGTNAIPTILKWISYEPSASRDRIAALVERLSPKLATRFIVHTERRASRAQDVFYILGPELRSAIPELTQFARTSSNENRAGRCTIALVCTGPEALPSVLTLVTNSSPNRRRWVLYRLVNFQNTEVGVPLLIQYLDDNDPWIAEMAMQILGGFDQSVVFPSLTNALHSPSAQTRMHAVKCMLLIGPPASEAVPVLLPMLADPEHEVRLWTTNILVRLAPEVLTNAPAP